MAFLGRLYYNGMGAAIDKEKAIKWLLAGAERGDALAETSLVRVYGKDSEYANPVEERRWKSTLAETEMWKEGIGSCRSERHGRKG